MKKQVVNSRNLERGLLAITTIIIVIMAGSYYANIAPELEDATDGYKKGTVVNLVKPVTTAGIRKVLENGHYFTDANYKNFVSSTLALKINEQGSVKNLGALNKKDFFVPASAFNKIYSDAGKLRFINSLAHLGMDSTLYAREMNNPRPYANSVATQPEKTGLRISGTVSFAGETATKDVSGILIKLEQLFASGDTTLLKSGGRQTEFFARTDNEGHYEFINLYRDGNYAVIPIKPGYEFGLLKGKAALNRSEDFNFTGQQHELRLLDKTAYRQIKNDKIFTIRTPKTFTSNFIIQLALMLIAFWFFHFALSIRNFKSDQFILPLLAFITGTGVVHLYAIQDPLLDEIFGISMAACASVVLFLFAILVFVIKNNPVNRFYQSRYFDVLHLWSPVRHQLKLARGYTWLAASVLLMIALAIFGTGPEGSGVKVNLFGIQVSEVSKYLMIIFFAAFFAANTNYFRKIPDNRWLTRNNILMFAFFGFLLAIYAFLGDLGPAIVLCLTFLFFYSFAKDDFPEMLAAAVAFAIILFATSKFSGEHSRTALPIAALSCCAISFLYAFLKKRHESIFFIILVISSFVLMAALPFDFAQRLADRNDMFHNIWENQLTGGDQVAHGIWSMNSGGLAGQGLGRGLSNVMPAYHTDMILQSIGEESGLLALVALFIAFGLLTYRSLLVARRTGKVFMFYLAAGIAVTALLQLIVIGAGTLGLIPLTGISVPFLSKGNVGLTLTLSMFLIIVIMSHEKGNELEMEYIKKNFDKVNVYSILFFFSVILIFIGTLGWYQIKSDQYIVKPALTPNLQGAWQYSYNPRIGIMAREIKSGNIFDQNGVLLATSDKVLLDSNKTSLLKNGVSTKTYSELISKKAKRYYPFGANLLFWLGDYNYEIALENNNGYAAENRHYSLLKGFDVPQSVLLKTTTRYKENRFLPPITTETELVRYDYSALVSFIKQGRNSRLLQEQNEKKRDIYLSLDVSLNEMISALIQSDKRFNNFRASVVVIDPKTGDVLASASNPAPSYSDLKLISNIDPIDYRDISRQVFGNRLIVPQDLGITFNSRPGSVIKVLDAFAALNQYGLTASQFVYPVVPGEIFRSGEPTGNVDMHQAIVNSSNIYFIKLANEKKLQASLFEMYDALGMNIINRGGFHFERPADYNNRNYFAEWDRFLSRGKNIYHNKRLIGSRRRLYSNYSDIAWGQGELSATPLHIAKMTGLIANDGLLQPSRFLYRTWKEDTISLPGGTMVGKTPGMSLLLGDYMREQSSKTGVVTGLDVHGKTGSPERDKIIIKPGQKAIAKRVTDALYSFYVPSPRLNTPLAFAIRIEEIGNSEHAISLAQALLLRLKAAGYF